VNDNKFLLGNIASTHTFSTTRDYLII